MIRAYTTFDIRNTADGYTKLSRKNWNTILQVVSMRCQVDVIRSGELWQGATITDFGYQHLPESPVYYFEFDSHSPMVYRNLTDELHYLKMDSNNIPMLRIHDDNLHYDVEMLCSEMPEANILYELI